MFECRVSSVKNWTWTCELHKIHTCTVLKGNSHETNIPTHFVSIRLVRGTEATVFGIGKSASHICSVQGVFPHMCTCNVAFCILRWPVVCVCVCLGALNKKTASWDVSPGQSQKAVWVHNFIILSCARKWEVLWCSTKRSQSLLIMRSHFPIM